MPEYKLYHFKRDHVQRAEHVKAVDDLEAVKKAAPLVESELAELWRGARRIKTFSQR
jgi:hypothetical protein